MNQNRGLLQWVAVLIAVLLALLAYVFFVLVPKNDALRSKRATIRDEYCHSHGWETYSSGWSYGCVDKNGAERVIPDSAWEPLK